MREFKDIEVGGRTLRFISHGNGSPAVVLEQGFGLPPDENFGQTASRGWPKVFLEIQKATCVITYGRVATGTVDVNTPRTCRHMMNELRMLLRRAEIAPPYVLVGHSFGGLTVQLYAMEYPREVAGMVLVDSSHPNQSARFARALPPETTDEAPALKRFRRAPQQAQMVGETIDLSASAAELRGKASPNINRLIVLSHSPTSAFHRGVTPDVSARLEQVWHELQGDLTGLSLNSTHRVASAAGHFIHIDEPQLVIDAILEVLRDVRGPTAPAH